MDYMANITMHIPPCKVERVTYALRHDPNPIIEVYFTSAPTVFRTIGDLTYVMSVLEQAAYALGEEQARHAARPLVPERDPDGMPAGWAEMHEDLAEDPLTAAVNANARILRDRAAVAAGADDPGDDEAQDAADRALRRAGVNPADLAELRGEDA